MGESNREAFEGAVRVLRAFVEANDRGDMEAMKSCLTRRSREAGGFTGPQEGAVFTLGEPTAEGEAVVIPVRMRPAGESGVEGGGPELQAVMVKEDGEWKFDLAESQDRMMKAIQGALGGAMEQMAGAMGEAMEGIAGAMAEAFGGEEEAPSWDAVSPEPSGPEVHAIPGMTVLERTQQAVSEALGFEVSVQADIRGMLRALNSDESAVLIDWLQDQLLTGWAGMLAAAAERVPLQGRLHGIRIEAARSAEERFIAADLNDLVYRMYPAHESGYYADDEIERVLPGVLAGMWTPMNNLSGHASIFGDADTAVSVEDYASMAGARCMRRISVLLGRNIALEVDWGEMDYIPLAGSMLLRWGLGRVLGGVALALGGEHGERMKQEMRKIRLSGAYTPGERRLVYEDGVLEMSPALSAQEAGCFWEVDVAAALEGTPIVPDANGGEESLYESMEDAAPEIGESEEADGEDGEEAEEGVTNDTLFRDAVEGIGTAVPAWEMQLEMVLGHKTPLKVDWNSLNGRYELVQGMVHVGVVQALEAVCAVGFDPATKESLAERVGSVRIEHRAGVEPGSRVSFDGDELVFALDMSQEVTGPPDGSLGDELRHLLASPSASGDRAMTALDYMSRLEDVMRRENLWPGDPPEGPIEVRGAFGCENMAFEQWLAWVLIPRVKEIASSGGSFPSSSQVGAYAVRELDTAGAPDVIGLLCEFDRFIEAAGT